MKSFSGYLSAFRLIRSNYRTFVPGFVLVSLLFCLVSALAAIVPWFLKEATNTFAPTRLQANTFYWYVAAYALCWTVAEVLTNIKGVFSAWILAGSDAALGKALLQQVMSMPHSEQAQFDAGKVASMITRACSAFSSITVSVFWILCPILIEFLVTLTALGQSTNAVFLLSFLICIIILGAISIVIAIQSRDLHSSLYKVITDRDGYIVERLHLLYDIRLNNAYEKENLVTEHHLNQVRRAIRKANVKMGVRLALMAFAIGVTLAVFTALSVLIDNDQNITPGDFVMIAGYVGMLTLQLRLLAGSLIELEKHKIALADGMAFLQNTYPETKADRMINFGKTGDVFELKNICIEKGGKRIINNLNYRFRNDRFTVIKGVSGRGKTSLMNAMLGLEPVAAGQILFYGTPISTHNSGNIIDQIAVAPQSAQVIGGTLRDNLCYGSTQDAIPDTFLMEILSVLNCAEAASGRLMSLDTRFHARGQGLSGGERQRIAIGRAIARKKPVMILDEPTASLDLDNAKRIISYLYAHISTLIVISHDAHLQEMADEVLELG